MSGINPGVLLGVCRLQVGFADDIGNSINISGTGFWVHDRGHDHLVTNRHNLDSTLKLSSLTPFRLKTVQIELRIESPPGQWFAQTQFFGVRNLAQALKLHPTADVAALRDPQLETSGTAFGHSTFGRAELATEQFLAEAVNPMDTASFVGYPGKDGKAWWDQGWNLPIARLAQIASWTRVPFTNDEIPTPDVALVSGLSFSGSSGSPLISHAKGMRAGDGLKGNFQEPRVLGIMSGHWEDKEPVSGMFHHSGLSYFTRSTAVLQLLDA